MRRRTQPTIRRVATLTIAALLLLTTVPTISLAPDLPDLPAVATSAEATHECPIRILPTGTSSDPLACNPCGHEDCVPSTDPCDHVNCDQDPGKECQKIYDMLAEFGLYGGSSVTECIPPVPPVPPIPTPSDVIDLSDEIRWDVAKPDRIFVGDTVTISGGVQNNLDVPVLMKLEMAPNTGQICSLGRFSTSGENNVREHEYLLFPNGTDEQIALLGGSGQGAVNGDTISFSATLAGKDPGRCSLDMHVVVQTVGGNDVRLGSKTVEFPVLTPPPSEADLGKMVVKTGTCSPHQVRGVAPSVQPVTVSSGDVKLLAGLDYSEECATLTDHTWILVEQKIDGDWIDFAGGHLASTGAIEVANETTLSEGDHKFRVSAVLHQGWFDWGCLVALISAGGAAASFAALILSPEPASKLALAGLLFGGAGAALTVPACFDAAELDDDQYTVKVKAVDSTQDQLEALVNSLASSA